MWTTMRVRDEVAGGGCFELRKPLAEAEARELNAVAGILEALALSLAPPFDDDAIAELREANAKLRGISGGGGSAVAVADHDFHRRLSEPCGDERLLATLAPVRRSIYRHAVAMAPAPGEVERAVADHDEIIDALADGDHGQAAQRLREHVAAGLSRLLATARPGSKPGPTSS
jgi:DNA-binding GntR family transcriptional regulator